jgi:hypothetical protein
MVMRIVRIGKCYRIGLAMSPALACATSNAPARIEERTGVDAIDAPGREAGRIVRDPSARAAATAVAR